VLVTGEKGFANVLSFPPGTHAGLIVVSVPNELPTLEVNRQVLRALAELEGRGRARAADHCGAGPNTHRAPASSHG
jgi:hypothetical protein